MLNDVLVRNFRWINVHRMYCNYKRLTGNVYKGIGIEKNLVYNYAGILCKTSRSWRRYRKRAIRPLFYTTLDEIFKNLSMPTLIPVYVRQCQVFADIVYILTCPYSFIFVVQCIIFCICKLLVGFSFLYLPYHTQV